MTTTELPPHRQGSPVAELLMTHLMGCVCTILAQAGRGACCCRWYRGSVTPPMDGCDSTCEAGQGVAWGRIVQRQNTQADAAVGRVVHFGGTCPPGGTQQWTVEIGVYRCIPDRPEGRTDDEHNAAAAEGAWDDDLLWEAVVCCDIPGIVLTPQTVVTAGPRGLCVGSILTLLADVPGTVPTVVPPAAAAAMPPPAMTKARPKAASVGW